MNSNKSLISPLSNCLLLLILALGCLCCLGYPASEQQFASRREDNQRRGQQTQVVMGKFKAPAPERIARQRIAKATDFGTQTMSASYRVAEASELPEKLVHGIIGSSLSNASKNNQRIVAAKIQVSDEGLNYPPSKLSADIYGNVAEIVTAPPEAVDSDFLLPQATSKLFGSRRN